MNSPAEKTAKKLLEKGATVAVAESCTGGLLASALTDLPGASKFFRGGAVTYATETKTEILGVPAELIARFGVVSANCAEAMARGAAEKFHTDFALSTTGIAGPDGGTPGTPVGTVFIGIFTPDGTSSLRFRATGTTRDAVRREAVVTALNALAERI
ncbi:MAG: nicotinamide-nucleotide amidohydrolase family protein [Opitutales bacterium]|nr:nicotinamide-nucleotide amidohydrolase family protein [Opitutales bacterium]